MEFGKAARRHWLLQDECTFLNHGSFGAVPLPVMAAQEQFRREMEAVPDSFFDGAIIPGDRPGPLRKALDQLGTIVGVSGQGLAFVENATTGIQAVLQSFPLGPGDEILLTDHQYNAVRLAVEKRCSEAGATCQIVSIPIPTSPDAVHDIVVSGASSKTRLAIIDHITSPTALVFPVEKIVESLQSRGIQVLVDGAHAIGQLDLNLPKIGADWYVTNLHKWLYTPRGTGLLYAAPSGPVPTNPVTTSHFIGQGFPTSFDYVGTRDYTAWLSSPAALAFFMKLGPDRLRAWLRKLIDHASMLMAELNAAPTGPIEMAGAMRSFILPQRRAAEPNDGHRLRDTLRREDRIFVHASSFSGALLLRISAQAYVCEGDIAKLVHVLNTRGWPGR